MIDCILAQMKIKLLDYFYNWEWRKSFPRGFNTTVVVLTCFAGKTADWHTTNCKLDGFFK